MIFRSTMREYSDMRAVFFALFLGLAGSVAGAQTDNAALRRAAESGDPQAAYAYGYALVFPQSGDPDPARGRHWLEQAAASGNPDASYLLGVIYLDGIDTEPDTDTARAFFRQAWDAGDGPAGLMLAEILLYDTEGAGTDARAILETLTGDADVGALARLTLADALFFPVSDIDPDRVRATRLAREALAMDPGLIEAHYLLGIAAMEGIDRPSEPAAAIEHWRSGSLGGDTLAMLALADTLADGTTGEPDPVGALALYSTAAALGDPDGQDAADQIAPTLSPDQQAMADSQRETWLAAIGE